MPPVDRLAVRSRRILTPSGWVDGTVIVEDGRIAAVDPAGVTAAGGSEGRRIDATDHLVLPGLVDTHAHFRDPGFTQKEDWATGSRAAAAGGVTTVLDMPNVQPPPNRLDVFEAHRANAATKSIVDFNHVASATDPEQIGPLAAAGAAAFKVFMMADVGRSYPHMPGIAVDDHARLYEICEAVAETGRPLMVHCHDHALYQLFVRRAIEAEGRGALSYARAQRAGDGVVHDLGVATMLELQRATGVRLHLLHTSTKGSVALIRAAKAEGRTVTAEANPFHLLVVNRWETIERHGPWALGQWVPQEHAEVVWSAVLDGTVDTVGSDHTPHTREEKANGWDDMFATPGGSPTIQHELSLLLSAASEGVISVERIVELCSSAPARLVGLYPRKGALVTGADADMVIVDPTCETVIREADVLSKCGWTILDGRRVRGVPVTTVSRGRVVWDGGRILAEPGSGRFVAPG